MSRWRRTARRVTPLGIGGVTLLLASAWALLSTEPGLRLAWWMGRGYLPEALSIASVSGSVRGPIGIEGLTYSSPAVRVGVERATVSWSLLALVRQRIDLA